MRYASYLLLKITKNWQAYTVTFSKFCKFSRIIRRTFDILVKSLLFQLISVYSSLKNKYSEITSSCRAIEDDHSEIVMKTGADVRRNWCDFYRFL